MTVINIINYDDIDRPHIDYCPICKSKNSPMHWFRFHLIWCATCNTEYLRISSYAQKKEVWIYKVQTDILLLIQKLFNRDMI